MPVLHPERTAGVIGVCTPYVPMPPTAAIRAVVGDDPDGMYMLWFQEPGVAEGVMDPQARMIFHKLMRGGISPGEIEKQRASGPSDMNPFRRIPDFEPMGDLIVTPDELDVYVEAFERSGFRGGVNWYRNIDRNIARSPEVGTQKLELPCLMVTAEWDMALRPELSAGMPALCSDLETAQVAKAGHWIQQEYPEELNAILTDWLKRRFA
jgi:pimeloyl-ACP methyl ester carboxylesterase